MPRREAKDNSEQCSPQSEFQHPLATAIPMGSFHEHKEHVGSTINDVNSILRAFQKKNPWITFTDDVYTYNNWPDKIDWNFVLFKIQQSRIHLHTHVQLLLLAGIVINDIGLLKNVNDSHGANALHYAAFSGNPNAVAALIVLGFDKEVKDKEGATALHYAAWSGNPNAVKALLALGFDKEAKDNEGATAFHFAAASGYAGAVKALITLGFDKDTKDNCGVTALHEVASIGDVGMVGALIALGCDKDVKDNNGDTILHKAAYSGSRSLMTMLIERYGLNPDVKNKAGKGILDWAKKGKYQRAIDFCMNTTHTSQLYRNYLASFIAPAIPYEVAIPDLANIIGNYAGAKDYAEQLCHEIIVQQGIKKRNEVLKPLIDFSDNDVRNDTSGRMVLNEILAKKTLAIPDIERQLDALLEDKYHKDEPYSYSLLQCRFNTAKKTGRAPGCTASNRVLIRLNDNLESTVKDLQILLETHQKCLPAHHGLQIANQGLQANHEFQYKLLIALSAVSVVALIVGAWAALDAGQEGAGGALIAVNVVVAGLVCYSIYNNSRTRAKVQDEAKHEEVALPADVP